MKNNIPQGYKATPLGIIPQEWEIKKLEEVGKLFSGLTYSPSDVQADGILVLRSSNIQKGQLVFEDNVFVNTPSYTPVKENDILICVRNGSRNLIGKTAMITKEVEGCAFGAFMSIFRSPINKYIFYLFGTELYRKYIYRNLGATINSINGNDLKRFRFPFPQIVEQQKIVNILSTWDEAIEKQSQLIEKLELRKKGLMQQLLNGKKRLPGFYGKWEKVKLGEICEKVTRKNTEDNKNVMTISAQRGFVSQTDFFNKSIASKTLESYYLVLKNEFCYNKSYSNGYPMGAIKRLSEADKAVVTPLYICFNVKSCTYTDINFLSYYLDNGGLNQGLTKIANEGGRAHGLLNVTPKDFFNLTLNIPLFVEQTAIAQVLTTADHEIELAKQKLELFRQQKHGLMQQLLTGKKRIKY